MEIGPSITAQEAAQRGHGGKTSGMTRFRKNLYRFLFLLARPLPSGYFKPFPWGQHLRGFIASRMMDHCGKNVNIERGCHFGDGAGIRIGDYSGIGIRAEVNRCVTIGRYVMMGPEVLILTENHHHERTDIPMAQQGYDNIEPVIIEDDVWIGQRAIILPGVRIGEGSIIGAGAVVSKSVPPYSIAVGNPARVVRTRTPRDAEEMRMSPETLGKGH